MNAESKAMAQALPPVMQQAGVPFDLFIQALTEQLDKAQASMALKARFAKLPMTFAVKDVSLDLRAFVQVIDDDVWVRPAGPGDVAASSIKLALTTITRPMIEENAVTYQAEDPKFSLREALGDRINDDEQRRLERIGVRSIGQLNELRLAAGVHLEAPLLRSGMLPMIRAAGMAVPVVRAQDQSLVLQPLAHQLGSVAEVDFGDGQIASVRLSDGSVGEWRDATAEGSA